jgi:hypothetical protein
MLALASVWIGLACLVLSLVMVVYRPAFTDVTIWLVLWLGSPGALCLAGLVLWAHRKDECIEAELAAQRAQCKVAIVEALLAAGIVYALVFNAAALPDGLPGL